MSASPAAGDRVELVVGHPGHELRLFGLLQSLKPRVWVLTTGAKTVSDRRRVEAANETVGHSGGRPGPIFGAALDAEVYADILAARTDRFERWIDQLADAFVADAPKWVVVDGWQLYSPVHDLAHLLGRIAAAEAGRRLGRALPCLQFQVVSEAAVQVCPPQRAVCAMELSDTLLAAKIAAARQHPGIEQELGEALADSGAALRSEALSEVPPWETLSPPPGVHATYETIALERVARGVYGEPLLWDHFDVIRRRLLTAHGIAVG